RIFRLSVASYLTVAVIFLTSARATPVASCGQTVEGEGVLTADLDCSATTGPAVFLERGARLELAGFTILGNEIGVQCPTGRGTIRRAGLPANQQQGIVGFYRATVSDVVLDNWPMAIYVLGPTKVLGCTIQNSGTGVLGERTRVADSSFSNNGIAVYGSAATP